MDPARLGRDLDERGAAVMESLLPAESCERLAALYDRQELFRSHIVMARHGFGQGEYRYFDYPLPEPVARLRRELCPPLAQAGVTPPASSFTTPAEPEPRVAGGRRTQSSGISRA